MTGAAPTPLWWDAAPRDPAFDPLPEAVVGRSDTGLPADLVGGKLRGCLGGGRITV